MNKLSKYYVEKIAMFPLIPAAAAAAPALASGTVSLAPWVAPTLATGIAGSNQNVQEAGLDAFQDVAQPGEKMQQRGIENPDEAEAMGSMIRNARNMPEEGVLEGLQNSISDFAQQNPEAAMATGAGAAGIPLLAAMLKRKLGR